MVPPTDHPPKRGTEMLSTKTRTTTAALVASVSRFHGHHDHRDGGRSHAMRKAFTTFAVMAAGAAALGATAGPPSADDPKVTYSQGGTMGFSRTLGCKTQYKFGGFGQYGAWGNFID